MNSHLSREQMAEWVGGERSRATEAHMRTCAVCQAEAEQFQNALAQFGSTLREWSAEKYHPSSQLQSARKQAQPSYGLAGWNWAALAVIICAAMGLFLQQSQTRKPTPIATETAAISDAALLKQVDQEVSRTVPSPMEPLVNLVSWDGNNSAATGNGTDE
jgi:anti-sigma factor RsiW